MLKFKSLFLLSFMFALTACVETPDQNLPLPIDYQRIDADWLTHDEAKLRKISVSNVQYSLQIDLTKSQRYTGTVEIRFDYQPLPFPLTIDFVGGEAERILVNNTPIAIDYSGNFINIPSKNLEKGNNTVKIQYSHAYSDNGSGLYRYKDPTDNRTYLYTHFEPYDANKLFPSFDQPNLRATYELRVVAPKSWTVVTSIRESEVITDGPYKRWKFPESANFSTYIFPLHAGPWHIWEGMSGKTPLRLMTRESLAEIIDVREWFRITQKGFKFFEQYFNSNYPFSKYDQLLVPDFNIGGMENVGAVTFTENYIPRGKASRARKRNIANTILHELSHMWFGDMVTIDWWSSLWLKESFASYMAPLALVKATDYKESWRAFYSGTKQGAYQADQRVTTHAIDMPVNDTKSGDASFDSITYNKGAAVLQQLAHLLGENKFRDGVRIYLEEHRNQAATLPNFFDALSKVSDENLQDWTDNWLNLAGVNTVQTEYQCKNGKISTFALRQSATEQHPYLRNHQLQIALYHLNDDKKIVATHVESVRISGEVTHLEQLSGIKCPLIVYPNHGDWGYFKVELDKKTLLMLPDNINSIKDNLSRSMLWQSLWDMVLDLKMPVTQYLDLIIKNAREEKDNEILLQLLSNAHQARSWLTSKDPINKKAQSYLGKLETLMLQQSQTEIEGFDRQQIWFQSFSEFALTEHGLSYLSNWLQGNAAPMTLATDQDQRWSALITLSASGHPDAEALIKNESLLDPSDNGAMMMLATEAGQPNLDVKQYWLDELLRNEERQTAARLKQAMSYLFPSTQRQLQQDFAERILSDLHYLDSNRGQTLVEHLVENILPTLCTEESVALLQNAQQEMHNLGLIAQKGIKIAHQEDTRCVAINALIADD